MIVAAKTTECMINRRPARASVFFDAIVPFLRLAALVDGAGALAEGAGALAEALGRRFGA